MFFCHKTRAGNGAFDFMEDMAITSSFATTLNSRKACIIRGAFYPSLHLQRKRLQTNFSSLCHYILHTFNRSQLLKAATKPVL